MEPVFEALLREQFLQFFALTLLLLRNLGRLISRTVRSANAQHVQFGELHELGNRFRFVVFRGSQTKLSQFSTRQIKSMLLMQQTINQGRLQMPVVHSRSNID